MLTEENYIHLYPSLSDVLIMLGSYLDKYSHYTCCRSNWHFQARPFVSYRNNNQTRNMTSENVDNIPGLSFANGPECRHVTGGRCINIMSLSVGPAQIQGETSHSCVRDLVVLNG